MASPSYGANGRWSNRRFPPFGSDENIAAVGIIPACAVDGPAKLLNRRRQFKDAEAGQSSVAHRRHRKGQVRIEPRFGHVCRLAAPLSRRGPFLTAKELEHPNMDERPEAQWDRAFLAGCQGMSDLGEPKKAIGQCWMPCGLQPEALASAVETGQNRALALAAAVRAAKEGAQATRHIVARRGRSSYWAIVL